MILINCVPSIYHGRSQSAKIVTYIKGGLLKRAVILTNCVPEILFIKGTPHKGKNSIPEGSNSFLYETSLMVGKTWFQHGVISLECVQF